MVSWLPGERYVALDLPRSDRQVVPFGPALEALRSHEGKDGLRIPLGVTPEGESVVIDLCVQPHIAIAGATGSGKTMLMVTSLAALVSQLSPEQVEVLIIDPKALDFVPFASLPHVRGGHIITEPEEAIDALIDLTEHELPRRTQLLQDAGCSSLRDLRARRPDLAVKYIVVAIDEYADLVAVLGKAARPAFERQILRLTQRARAIGIHIILATQRPSTEFVTGAVKSNLPTRIAFRLPQRIDSMVILDQPGAERLLGSGDMLLSRDGRIQRIQGYFASMEESASLMAERIAELKGGR
jgi:S-DNA-T family DNA segregation ATPase FtsK/SpoIIIE